MSRTARSHLNCPFLHVMVQGVNKEYIFNNEWYIKKYLCIINKNISKYDITIIAYCIMSNHAHLLIYVNDIRNLGDFMHDVNLEFANLYNKSENRVGVIFRNRYKTEPILDMKYLINCIKYIHNNPVKAKMVSKCEEYKYSSYNDFMTNTGCSQSNIMKKVFGENFDYIKAFKSALEIRYMDLENRNSELVDCIASGINQFERKSNKNIGEILSNSIILSELMNFLNEECKCQWKEIGLYFGMSVYSIKKIREIKKQ